MGTVCPVSSPLCFSKINPVVGFHLACPKIFLILPFPCISPKLSFGQSKPVCLSNPDSSVQVLNRSPCPSFDCFYPGNLNSGRDSRRKRRWTLANFGKEPDFLTGQTPENDKIGMETVENGDEEKGDADSTDGSEDLLQSNRRGLWDFFNRRSLWDFFKLKRERGLQSVTGKGTGLDSENIEIQWRDIVDPTPENLLALVLTGFLGLAVLRIFWQLLLVSVTVVIAAFKYSVIAAILIALLVVFL